VELFGCDAILVNSLNNSGALEKELHFA
jgi:hypothetical protein